MIFAEAGKPIRLAHLPLHLRQGAARTAPASGRTLRPLKEVEADYIREVIEACGGNRRKAAEILGLSVVTLWRKFKKDGEEEPEGPIGE